MPDITQIQVGTTTYDIKDNISQENINSISTLLNSLSTSISTMAFAGDVPLDDKSYVRKNKTWSELTNNGTWGSITGTLNNQTDLQSALNAKADIIHTCASGSVVTITDGTTYPITSLNITINPIQNGSGDPSSSNIRSITGCSSLNLTRVGKNFAKPLAYVTSGTTLKPSLSEYITQTTNGYSYTDTVTNRGITVLIGYFKAGEKIVFSATSSNNLYRILFSTTLPTTSDLVTTNVKSVGNNNGVWYHTCANDGYYWGAFYKSGQTFPVTVNYIQGELGTVATSYEAYQGTDVSILFNQTIYGGILNVLTGILTITDENIASYAGESLPGEWISDRDIYTSGGTPTTGAQVVYKLATPTTIQLTANQINLLFGKNNIYANTGNISIEYYADTKLYINENETLRAIATSTSSGLMSASDKQYLDNMTNIVLRPDYIVSTVDLTDGTSSLESGKLYFYYEA